jgi:RNA polymerase sigma-70 factor, ECF subfamily
MGDSSVNSKLKELEKLITEFQDQLFSFAFFRTGSFSDSQDIVQEVFIKLYKNDGCLDAVHNIRFYLFRCISNACIDYHRGKKKNMFETLDTATIPVNFHSKEASYELLQIEEYQRIEALLSDLPIEQAEIIRLRVLDGLGFMEIAEILEIPVTTVKSRFNYGIDKLKIKIEKLKEVKNGL